MASELEMREAEDAIDRLRDQLAAKDAEIAALKQALADLVSWFDDLQPVSKPIWQLPAGPFGADDAIAAARAITQDGRAGG